MEGKQGVRAGEGQGHAPCSSPQTGQEEHPPCTSALGPGTPARSSHTASGPASCSPCGRRLHRQKKDVSSSSRRRGEVGKRSCPVAQGRGFSPAKCLNSGDNLDQGLLSPLPQSSRHPKIRTSNKEPLFSVLTLILDSVSRLVKFFGGSCTKSRNSNRVQIKERLQIMCVVNPLRSEWTSRTFRS